MKDAFGAPQSLLVLGGTSRIALATARRLVAGRTRTVRLAGRPSPALESAADELRTCGADVATVDFDALAPETHETVLGKVFAEGDIDVVLLAFGVAGDQERDEEEPLGAVRVAQTNYTGAVSAGLVCAGRLQAQGHGSLVVLSSVSGERARRADFIYGSSKAGLDAFAQGLGEALRGTGVHVMVVRPGTVRPEASPTGPVDPTGSVDPTDPTGSVDPTDRLGPVDPDRLGPVAPTGPDARTRETAPRSTTSQPSLSALPRPTTSRPAASRRITSRFFAPRHTASRSVAPRLMSRRLTAYKDAASRIAAAPLEAPPLVATPDAVAAAIVTGLRRRSEAVWVPGALRVVMSAVRHVPHPLFRRLPL